MIICFIMVPSASAKDIVVSKTGSVTTITQALKKAEKGDRILVERGVYTGNQILVNKPVIIEGKPGAILDGLGKYQILRVTADHVVIKNMTFINAGISYIHDNAAIKLDSVSSCVISHNTLRNNFFGIYLAKSENCIVTGNSVIGNGQGETASGGGIHLWNCNHITVSYNYLRNNRDGIYFEFVNHTLITHNLSEYNIRYGLHLMYSNSDTYTYNTFRNNHAGGVVMYSKNITITHNRFEHNWGPSEDGVLLKELNKGEIRHNYFFGNTTALYSEGSNNVRIEQNDFSQNGWAVNIMSNSAHNLFTHNDFTDNTFDVVTSGQKNTNNFTENYWSGYNGYDLNHDGIGDIPYHPVSLFSYIVEQQSPSLILLHSLFIKILGVAERALPVLTPKTLVDIKPMMKKYDTDREFEKEVR